MILIIIHALGCAVLKVSLIKSISCSLPLSVIELLWTTKSEEEIPKSPNVFVTRYTLFYKNILYKNIEGEILLRNFKNILRINPRLRF